jgi:hypothetical protein
MKLTGEPRLGATITLLAWGATGFGISPILHTKRHARPRAIPRSSAVLEGLIACPLTVRRAVA